MAPSHGDQPAVASEGLWLGTDDVCREEEEEEREQKDEVSFSRERERKREREREVVCEVGHIWAGLIARGGLESKHSTFEGNGRSGCKDDTLFESKLVAGLKTKRKKPSKQEEGRLQRRKDDTLLTANWVPS